MRGIDHADPLQHHHPYRAGLPRHPTQDTTTATRTTHQHAPGRDRPWATPTAATGPEDMHHTHPTIRSRRSPPERPTAHTQASTTPTTDRPSAARTRTHSRTAATITTNRHSTSHHDAPKPAAATTTTTVTTARDDMSTNHSSTNSAQRPDQRKHQTSRHRNNHQPKNKLQAPQGIPPGGPIADRTRVRSPGSVQV